MLFRSVYRVHEDDSTTHLGKMLINEGRNFTEYRVVLPFAHNSIIAKDFREAIRVMTSNECEL